MKGHTYSFFFLINGSVTTTIDRSQGCTRDTSAAIRRDRFAVATIDIPNASCVRKPPRTSIVLSFCYVLTTIRRIFVLYIELKGRTTIAESHRGITAVSFHLSRALEAKKTVWRTRCNARGVLDIRDLTVRKCLVVRRTHYLRIAFSKR